MYMNLYLNRRLQPRKYFQENRRTGLCEHTNTHVQYESQDSIAGAPLLLQILFSIVQAVSRRILTAEGRLRWICCEKKWLCDRFLSEHFDSIFPYKHRSINSAQSFDSSPIEFSRGLQFVCMYKHTFNILKNSHDISRFSSYFTENSVCTLERLVS